MSENAKDWPGLHWDIGLDEAGAIAVEMWASTLKPLHPRRLRRLTRDEMKELRRKITQALNVIPPPTEEQLEELERTGQTTHPSSTDADRHPAGLVQDPLA